MCCLALFRQDFWNSKSSIVTATTQYGIAVQVLQFLRVGLKFVCLLLALHWSEKKLQFSSSVSFWVQAICTLYLQAFQKETSTAQSHRPMSGFENYFITSNNHFKCLQGLLSQKFDCNVQAYRCSSWRYKKYQLRSCYLRSIGPTNLRPSFKETSDSRKQPSSMQANTVLTFLHGLVCRML